MRLSKEAWAHKKKTDDRKKPARHVDKCAPGTFEGYVKTRLEKLDGDNKIDFLLDSLEFIKEYENETAGTAGIVKSAGREGVSQLIDGEIERNPKTVLARFKMHQGDYDDDDYAEVCRANARDNAACFLCESCGGYLLNDASNNAYVCEECGSIVEATAYDGGHVITPSDHENMTIETKFCYKRINHFNEWVTSLQGRENTDIPNEVVEKVRAEFVKARMTAPEDITQLRVRAFLKKLGHNKLYEHSYHICRILGGTSAKLIPPDLEAQLKTMFSQIQEPFERVKPPERKNFLSYSFVLFKFMELLGRTEYLPFLPLLKSSEKLFQQDKIWRQICEILHWQFIPTL